MPTEIYLVKVGMNMTEGVVEEWYVDDGDDVVTGELLYRLETEKVNLDVDAEVNGTVKHVVGEGVTMAPGDVVGYIYAVGEEIPENLPTAGSAAAASPAAAVSASIPSEPAHPSASRADGHIKASPLAKKLALARNLDLTLLAGTGPGGRIVEADIIAAGDTAQPPVGAAEHPTAARSAEGDGERRSSPMARKLARELGVDLSTVTGSGPGGRITRDDIEAATGFRSAPAGNAGAGHTATASDRTVALKGMRKTIATRMYESLQTTAQLTMDMDVAMDDAVKLRSQLIDEWADRGVRPTYTDLVVRAAAKALEKHPAMNSQLSDAGIVHKGAVHVGMAVALEEGLIVPVIRDANRRSMLSLAEESARLAAAARNGQLSPDDLADGTFTVSALGMFGVDSFTPIINTPQAGILGVNRIRDDVGWEGSTPVKRQVMRLSLTWDHRILDGAPAAGFLAEVRDLLAAPYRLLV